ncbi:13909_t:CDS:2 [Racocetra persica]|uniref:13909_t:CDS:1 n=1 Tax=Racocetra persica TaxID=160502 RepID=A0ACA9KLZ1_9GLOM|nr:13909_t:CDS:2 [Racocetra persica]
MDSFKEKAHVLSEIRSKFTKLASKFPNNSDLISTNFHTSFRQKLFVDYGYGSSIYDDETSFFKLFESQLDNEIPAETIHQDEISKIETCFGESVKTKFLNAVNSAHKFCLQKCREQKQSALRDIFMLPSGNKEQVIKTLNQIDSSFVDMLSQMIEQFRVTIGFYNVNTISMDHSCINQSRFKDDTKQILESYFCEISDRPNHSEKLKLSETTGLSIKQIETWFNNRRNRAEKDNEKLERLTTEFLDKKVDWEDKFTAVRSGKITAKDMRTIIIQAFDLPYTDLIEEEPLVIADDIEITKSNESSSRKKSTKTHGRLTKEARKKAAPYNKSSPMTTKRAMMRKNEVKNDIIQNEDSRDFISTAQYSTQVYENELSTGSNISQQTTTDVSDNSVAKTKMTTLKIRHRPNKNLARAISQPYNRTQQNKQVSKNNEQVPEISIDRHFRVLNEPVISRAPSMDEEQFQVAEEIQQDLDFTQVDDVIQYASLPSSSASSFEGDIFDYISTYAPTTSFSNLSDISDFSQASDIVDFDQLNDISNDISTLNSYCPTLPFVFEQYDSSSMVMQSSNDHDFTFNAVSMPNLSDSYLDYASGTSNFVSTDTLQNHVSEQESAVDMTNHYMNVIQQTYLDDSNFIVDPICENIGPNDVES